MFFRVYGERKEVEDGDVEMEWINYKRSNTREFMETLVEMEEERKKFMGAALNIKK
jgi:hypothetical protein